MPWSALQPPSCQARKGVGRSRAALGLHIAPTHRRARELRTCAAVSRCTDSLWIYAYPVSNPLSKTPLRREENGSEKRAGDERGVARGATLTNVATALLTVCALSITGLLVRREVSAQQSAAPSLTPTVQKDWESYAQGGHVLGNDSAAVTIVEFADFECGFCKRFHEYADSLHARGKAFKVVYRHFPLSNHRFAIPAARASECASEQGQFEAMHRVLYAHADSLGLAPWAWFAQKAGVADSAAFEQCVRANTPLPSLARDTLDARRLGVNGTPALLIGPLRFQGVPSLDSLSAYIDRAAAEQQRQ